MQKIIPFKKEVNFKDNVSEITSISLEHSLHREKQNEIAGEFIVSGEYKVIDTSSVLDRFSFELPFSIHMDEKYDITKTSIDIDDFYYEIINSNILSVHIDVVVDKIEEKEIIEEPILEEVREVPETEAIEKAIVEEIETLDLDNTEVREELIEELKEEIKEFQAQSTLEESSEEERTITEQPEVLESPKEEPVRVIPMEEESSETKEELSRDQKGTKIDTVDTISSIFDQTDKKGLYQTYRVYIVREEDTIDSILQKYEMAKEELEKYNELQEVKKGDKLIIPCLFSEKV